MNISRENKILTLMIAIILASTFIPYIGYINFPYGISATTVFVPVSVGIAALNSRKHALILGIVFGISSFLIAIVDPGFNGNIFRNPLISILPRIVVGLISFEIYNLTKSFRPIQVRYLILGFSTSFFNTLFVVLMITIFYSTNTEVMPNGFYHWLSENILLTAPFEWILNTIIVTIVVSVMVEPKKVLNNF